MFIPPPFPLDRYLCKVWRCIRDSEFKIQMGRCMKYERFEQLPVWIRKARFKIRDENTGAGIPTRAGIEVVISRMVCSTIVKLELYLDSF